METVLWCSTNSIWQCLPNMIWTFWCSTGEKFARFWRLPVIIPSKLSQMGQIGKILWWHLQHNELQKKTTCIFLYTHAYRTYLQNLEAACAVTWKLRRRAKPMMILLQHVLHENLLLKRPTKVHPCTQNASDKVLTVEKEKRYSCEVAYYCE